MNARKINILFLIVCLALMASQSMGQFESKKRPSDRPPVRVIQKPAPRESVKSPESIYRVQLRPEDIVIDEIHTPEGITGERGFVIRIDQGKNPLLVRRGFTTESFNDVNVYILYSNSDNLTKLRQARERNFTSQTRDDFDISYAKVKTTTENTNKLNCQMIMPFIDDMKPNLEDKNPKYFPPDKDNDYSSRIYYYCEVEKNSNVIGKSTIKSFLMPPPLVIALMGDSYSCGEGAPQQGTERWTDEPCHRSMNSGQYMAIQEFNRTHKTIAVYYKPFFVGCSGAESRHIYNEHFEDDGVIKCDQTQIDLLTDILSNHDVVLKNHIDLIVLSIGGNDVLFAKVVEHAMIPLFDYRLDPLQNEVEKKLGALKDTYESLYENLDNNFTPYRVLLCEYPDATHGELDIDALLSGSLNLQYNEICGVSMPSPSDALLKALEVWKAVQDTDEDPLKRIIAVAEIVIGASVEETFEEYIIKLSQDLAYVEYCCPESYLELVIEFIEYLSGRENVLQCPALEKLCISKDEMTFITNNVYEKLIETIAVACDQYKPSGPADPNGWIYVGGNKEESLDNGVCRCDSPNYYFNTIVGSFMNQGDHYGAVHMNKAGQENTYKITVGHELNKYSNRKIRETMYDKWERLKETDNLPVPGISLDEKLRLKNLSERNQAIMDIFQENIRENKEKIAVNEDTINEILRAMRDMLSRKKEIKARRAEFKESGEIRIKKPRQSVPVKKPLQIPPLKRPTKPSRKGL